MTIFKDSHHFSRTLGDVWWESLRTATTSVELWTMFDDNPYSTTPYHKVLDFTTVLSTQPAGSDERVARRHYKFAFYHNFERPTRTKSREGCHSTTPYDKVLDFTTVLSTQTAGSDERVARRHWNFAFYHNFERPTRTKSREGCHGQPKNSRFTTVLGVRHVRSDERVARPHPKFAFYLSFGRPTRPKWRKGRSATSKICVLPQFWASNTSEVMKGSIRELRNLHFTTVLNVRHVRSDEKVDRRAQKFAFYHSFERPTRTNWREGCQIHRCDPCAPGRKRIYFNTFSDDFD